MFRSYESQESQGTLWTPRQGLWVPGDEDTTEGSGGGLADVDEMMDDYGPTLGSCNILARNPIYVGTSDTCMGCSMCSSCFGDERIASPEQIKEMESWPPPKPGEVHKYEVEGKPYSLPWDQRIFTTRIRYKCQWKDDKWEVAPQAPTCYKLPGLPKYCPTGIAASMMRGLRKIGDFFVNCAKAIGNWLKKNWKTLIQWTCRIVGAIIALLPIPGAALIGAGIIALGEVIIGLVGAIKKAAEGGSFWDCLKEFGTGVIKGAISFASQIVGKYTSGKGGLGEKATAILNKIKDSPVGQAASKIAGEVEKIKDTASQIYKDKMMDLQELEAKMEPDLVAADKEISKEYWNVVKVKREWREKEAIFREDEDGQVWGYWDGGVSPDGIKPCVWYRLNGSAMGGLDKDKMDPNAKKEFGKLIEDNIPEETRTGYKQFAEGEKARIPSADFVSPLKGKRIGGVIKKKAAAEKKPEEAGKPPAKLTKMPDRVVGGKASNVLGKDVKMNVPRELSKEEKQRMLQRTPTEMKPQVQKALAAGKSFVTKGRYTAIGDSPQAALGKLKDRAKELKEEAEKEPWYESSILWIGGVLALGTAAAAVRRRRRAA